MTFVSVEHVVGGEYMSIQLQNCASVRMRRRNPIGDNQSETFILSPIGLRRLRSNNCKLMYLRLFEKNVTER